MPQGWQGEADTTQFEFGCIDADVAVYDKNTTIDSFTMTGIAGCSAGAVG